MLRPEASPGRATLASKTQQPVFLRRQTRAEEQRGAIKLTISNRSLERRRTQEGSTPAAKPRVWSA